MSATRPDLEQPLVARADEWPAPGARIANARGVPGSIGCVGITRADHRPVLLTAHHVLFGAGAREGDPVWLLDDDRSPRCVARTLHGRAAVVRHRGEEVFVDCAVALLEEDDPARRWRAAPQRTAPVPAAGDRVSKRGAGSGWSEGVVIAASRTERVLSSAGAREAPGQLVVRGATPPFTGPGDSGAALRDARGAVAGILWGVNARGESVACPIAPVLHLLQLRLVRAPGEER